MGVRFWRDVIESHVGPSLIVMPALCLRLQRGSGARRWGLEGRGRGHTRWGNVGEGVGWAEVALRLAASVLLFAPGAYSDMTGAALTVAVLAQHHLRRGAPFPRTAT
jgi:hypothetical protein